MFINSLFNTLGFNTSPFNEPVDLSDLGILTASSDQFVSVREFTIDPMFYHPSANSNFSFTCEYLAPQGQVNLQFPDSSCADFGILDAYSGGSGSISELIVDDFLFFGDSGSYADVSLELSVPLLLKPIYSGESSSSTLQTSALFLPSATSGQTLDSVTLVLLQPILLEAIAQSGETLEPTLRTESTFVATAQSGDLMLASVYWRNYETYILSEGPSAYWKFDEQSGTFAYDYTGNNPPANNVGATTSHSTPVASHYAYYFDGSTSTTVIGNPAITSNNLTQELWVKPDAGAAITFYSSYVSSSAPPAQRFAVYPNNGLAGSGGGISVGSNGIQIFTQGTSNWSLLLSYQAPISTTDFTHILVSWANRVPTLYVNGKAVGTGLAARSPFVSKGLPSSGVEGAYKGYMQDVALYNYALTAAKALEHYRHGTGEGYVPFLEIAIAHSGSAGAADLTLDLSTLKLKDASAGEFIETYLAIFFQPQATAHSGDYSDASLLSFPLKIFENPTGHSGSSGEVTLRTNAAADAIFSLATATGAQAGSATLSSFPAAVLSPDIWYTGTTPFADLQTFSNLTSIAHSGSRGETELSSRPSEVLEPIGRSGEWSTLFDLSVTYALFPVAVHGEEAVASLGFDVDFPGMDATSGAWSYATELFIHPGDEFVPTARSGPSGSARFSTTYNLPSRATSGATGSLNFTTFPEPLLFPVASHGILGTAVLQTSARLKPNLGYHGSFCILSSIENEPHWYNHSGSSADLTLSVELDLPCLGRQGSIASVLSLTVPPAHNFGFTLGYSGQAASVSLDAKEAIFMAVTFFANQLFEPDPHTYFDLSTDECCKDRKASNVLLLHLEKWRYDPSENASGNRVLLDIDLAAAPRFRVDFTTGTGVIFDDSDLQFYLPEVLTGTRMDVEFEPDLSHRLCTGHFIPTADWIVMELQDVLSEDCYVDRFYSGQTLECVVTYQVNFQFYDIGTGADLVPDLTVEPPWLIIFKTGTRADFELAPSYNMPSRAHTGYTMTCNLYEEFTDFYSGCEVQATLTTDYGIRFLEQGCLDNQFRWLDQDGDEIAGLFQSVPIEGEPYFHSIRIECF